MRNIVISSMTAGLLLGLMPLAARAKDGPAAPPDQSRAFALAYTLRSCDLRAMAFTQSVKRLKLVDDDLAAGAEVGHLSTEASKLRHTQAIAYDQVARLLTKMGAPGTLQAWAAQTAAALAAPLAYSEEAQSVAKTEPGTALVLAELDELQAVKTAANAKQPTLAAWLKLNGGPLAVWTADVGGFAADLHAAMTSSGQGTPALGTARRLLQKAPLGAPSGAREALAGLIPRGGGNLQSLATAPPPNVSPQKMSGLLENLLGIYVPRKPVEKMDQAGPAGRQDKAEGRG
jgi:hypothetical protein